MLKNNIIREISLATARQLVDTIDPGLPQITQIVLDDACSPNNIERFGDPSLLVAVASLLVTTVGVTWTICKDIKDSSKKQKVTTSDIERKVLFELKERDVTYLSVEQQTTIVKIVVTETLKQTSFKKYLS